MRIATLVATAFSALLLASSAAHAVGGGGGGGIGGGGGVGSPAPSKAPLGAPPGDDSTAAYAFRANMSQEPNCQQLSQEADRVFMDGQLAMDQKVEALNKIKARAQQSNCIQKQPRY